jgi:hypothetical protein
VSDVIYIAVMIAFFVLCTLYVQLCDRMIGPDELAMPVQGTDSGPDGEPAMLVAATAATNDGVTE